MLQSDLTGIAGTTASQKKAHIWSLVLWSAGITHQVILSDRTWILTVDSSTEDVARLELARFEEENKNWPPLEKGPVKSKDAAQNPPTVFMMGILIILYSITGPRVDNSPLFNAGAVIGEQILKHGEWWRTVTGLTLHADPVHILGNVLIGGFLVHFLCKTLGNGLGWFLILLSGAMGNYINILFHGPTHNSIGFSTAVFGTIGLLAGWQSIRKRGVIKAVMLPFAAGLGLLALLGASGENTDLGAHFFGLLTGFTLGVILGIFPGTDQLVHKRSLQIFLFFGSLILVITCWGMALE